MRMVIKIAGALLERDEDVQTIARQITELARAGHELLVIHGGGKIFTATLARMGITSRFVNGLRVTDRETRDAAVMVFAGLLNKKLAGAISLAGQPAVGISATDAACFLAEPMQLDEREGSLGFVGYLTEVNVDFLRSLWRAGIVPVASCMGLGADGELYNINADHMAAAAAEFIRADRLIFLTDVAGVLDGEKVLRAVRGGEIEDLIRQNKVSGGMILKLEAAKRALAGGVAEVRIVGGTQPRALLAAVQRRALPGHARSARHSLRPRKPRTERRVRKWRKRKRRPAKSKRFLRRRFARDGSALPDEHLPAAAGGVHARARLPPLRFARARISRFSGGHRRQCAGLRASAAGARDSPRSGPRHARFESVSQSVSGAARAQAREWSGLDRVFFTNSGTEAIEGALKLARAYAHAKSRASAARAEDAHSGA